MRGIVSQTETINARVHDNISPKLYLFCNYDEGRRYWISEDGKYIYNVSNLYRVMIDTNYITGHAREILSGNDSGMWKRIASKIQYSELQNLIGLISCFRSVEAHNVSAANGYFQRQEKKEYDRWVLSVIKTDRPSTEAHYKALNMELEKISVRCENYIKMFLNYVEQASDKKEIAERWGKAIINKYSQTEDYLYGQMADMYLSLYHARRGYDTSENMNKNKMRNIIRNWIMNYYLKPYDAAKALIEENLRKNMGIIKSTEGRRKLQEQAEKKQEELNIKKEGILKEISDWSHLRTTDYLLPKHFSCFFLEKTMPELIEKLMTDHPEYTLLPQDILQSLVYIYMREFIFK